MSATASVARTGGRLASGLLGLFLVLHGVAHFVGTSSSLKLVEDGDSADYLMGRWEIASAAALRALAVAWAIGAVAYFVAAIAIWIGARQWRAILIGATVYSLILSIAALWQSVVGVVIDVGLLVFALSATRWRPRPLVSSG